MVGQNAVRSLSVTLAMEQISRAKELEPFKVQARELWEHCLEVAALAFVIGKRRGLANPDEALFAGLVHDLGHFYLMWRATQFPELVEQPDEIARDRARLAPGHRLGAAAKPGSARKRVTRMR